MGHKKEQHKAEEAGGEKVPLWYISFADMITLLMSFFVMLSTFSSYDFSARKKLIETIHTIAFFSLAPSKDKTNESIIKSPPVKNEWVMRGQEKPPEDKPDLDTPKNTDPGPEEWIPEIDAFMDRKIIRIPATRLFYADGANLSPQGRHCLDLLARYLSKMPCQIVIGSTAGSSGGYRSTVQDKLNRAWAVMDYLKQKNLSHERFALAGGQLSDSDRTTDDAIEIVLLSWSLLK